MSGSSFITRSASSIVGVEKDRQAVANEDSLFDERPGCSQMPFSLQLIHIGEMVGDEGCNFARWSDHPVERNEQGFL
jgi:hypothetical protein